MRWISYVDFGYIQRIDIYIYIYIYVYIYIYMYIYIYIYIYIGAVDIVPLVLRLRLPGQGSHKLQAAGEGKRLLRTTCR